MTTLKEYDAKYHEFLKLYGTMTNREVAKRIGVHPKTISNWVKGRPERTYENTKRIDPGKLSQIKDMLDDGCSHDEISRTLHVGTGTIRKYFPNSAWTTSQVIEFVSDVRKIKGAKRGINSQTLMRAKGYLETGSTIPEAARQAGVSVDTLRKYFPDYVMSRSESAKYAHGIQVNDDQFRAGLQKASYLLRSGYSIPEAAKASGVSEWSLRKYYPEYKMSQHEAGVKGRRSQNR